jgi:hypothetical protein
MNVKDLYSAVARLGFETSLEDSTSFLQATNAAIFTINRVKPHVAKYDIAIFHFPDTALSEGNSSHLSPKAVSLLCISGKGKLKITNETTGNIFAQYNLAKGQTLKKLLNTEPNTYYRFEVIPESDNHCVVSNLAVFSDFKGAESDIPIYEEFVPFDLKSLTNDFLQLTQKPFGNHEIPLNDFYISHNVIYIRYSYLTNLSKIQPILSIWYQREPRMLELTNTANIDEQEIDLSEELCQLLPYLVASRVWAEDEPAMAEHCLQLYQMEEAKIKRAQVHADTVKIVRTGRW